MPDKGIVRGTHHLTFCVAGAQEDYDFHTGLLGLYCVKKTVLFDGELPIYHLYYANRVGDGSTVLTSFPYGQQGIYGKRGTNQLKSINIAVPADSIGYWADRLATGGVEYAEGELFGAPRLHFAHPCGIPYVIVGESEKDDREPWDGGDVPGDHAIRGAYGTTTSLRDPEPMGSFLTDAMNGELVSSEGPNHQYRIGTDEGYGRMIELVEEPDLPQGTWQFGAGTIHHHAFDVVEPANQAVVKDWIVGLGFTDVSDVKDRGYFFSVYLRTPGGALFELAQSAGRGFLVDETYEELGTNMCIPPHWEHRRSEIATLEPIVTREPVA